MSALSSSGAASASASGAASASAAAPVSAASSSVAPNYRFVSATSSAAGSKAIAVLKFSPDGTLVAAAGADATLRVFRVGESVDSEGETIPTLLPLFERPAAHDAGINDIAFTHDARYILTASDDKTVVIWEVESGQPLRTYSGHTSYVFCLAVSGSGNLLVTGSYDESVKVWDLKNAKCTRTISAHSDPVSAVDFNRDGSLIVSSSYDGLCRVWDTSSGRCLKTIYNDKTPPVSFVRFSPNGKYILASSLDSTLRLWDYSRKDHCLKEYTGHVNTKFCLPSSFSTLHVPRQYIISGSEDGRIVFWDVVSKEAVASVSTPHHKEAVLCVAAHPTKTILVSASIDAPHDIVLWRHVPITTTTTTTT